MKVYLLTLSFLVCTLNYAVQENLSLPSALRAMMYLIKKHPKTPEDWVELYHNDTFIENELSYVSAMLTHKRVARKYEILEELDQFVKLKALYIDTYTDSYGCWRPQRMSKCDTYDFLTRGMNLQKTVTCMRYRILNDPFPDI